ncbi:alpha/beta hydrolase [Pseudarthrobacter sp. NPDC089323]
MSAASIPGASTYATAPTRSITTGGVSYAYRELGPKGGVPVVFFVHLAGNLDNWDPQIIDAVAKEHHVVTFNNRGIGASTGVVPGSVEAMAEDAADFIRALGFEKVDIFGFSLGGMVAQALIGKHPDLVRKLVLAGTGPRGGKGMDKVARVTYFDVLRAALLRADPKEFLFFDRSAAGKQAAKEFITRIRERTTGRDRPVRIQAFRTQLKAIRNWGRAEPADLSAINHPTLIANGDHDRMVPSILSQDLHRRIAGSELVIYQDSGHGGIFQFHQQFIPAAVEFLKR